MSEVANDWAPGELARLKQVMQGKGFTDLKAQLRADNQRIIADYDAAKQQIIDATQASLGQVKRQYAKDRRKRLDDYRVALRQHADTLPDEDQRVLKKHVEKLQFRL